jgi:PAS domain S-box-containing protein
MLATSRITLVQGQFGFLVFNPVYRKGAAPNTPEARRAHLIGFALGVFRIGDMIETALSQLPQHDVDLYLFDKSAPTDTQFLGFHGSSHRDVASTGFDNGREMAALRRTHGASFDMAGRQWVVICVPTPEFLAASKTWVPWGVLGAGLVITALISIYLLIVLSRTSQARRFAQEILLSKEALEKEISRRQETAEALQASVEKYRAIFENSSIGIYRDTIEPQGRFLEANPAMIQIFGYDSINDFLSIEVTDLYQNPGDRRQFIDALLRAGFIRNMELRMRKKDSTPILGSVTAKVQQGANGQILWIDGIVEDITERKRAEESLRTSHRQQQAILDNIPDIAWLKDTRDASSLSMNRSVKRADSSPRNWRARRIWTSGPRNWRNVTWPTTSKSWNHDKGNALKNRLPTSKG